MRAVPEEIGPACLHQLRNYFVSENSLTQLILNKDSLVAAISHTTKIIVKPLMPLQEFFSAVNKKHVH